MHRASLEQAENMRRAIAAQAIYDNKIEMQNRINAELEALGKYASKQYKRQLMDII